jgi:uncharacterized protein (TIGR01777 family)
MRILVTGASGLVGAALVPALTAAGHRVTRLVRVRPRGPDEFRWIPDSGLLDPAALADCEAVIHLAGESIAAGRWTRRRKALIRESRVAGTRLLATGIARAIPLPRSMICASAVGYYGDRGDQVLDEVSGPGEGFLAGLTRDWEAAAEPASRAGARVVHLRLGMVLSRDGGALPRLLLAFGLGLGGPFGSGHQWLSWVALDDLIAAFGHALTTTDLNGPVNAVTPDPVTNREFARTLGRALGRPSWLRAPAWALRLLLGEMGEELLLSSQRVIPQRLLASGFQFRQPELDGALRRITGRTRPGDDERRREP